MKSDTEQQQLPQAPLCGNFQGFLGSSDKHFCEASKSPFPCWVPLYLIFSCGQTDTGRLCSWYRLDHLADLPLDDSQWAVA